MNTDTIRELVRSECQRDSNRFGPAFFDQHILPATSYGRRLALRLGANTEVVELAGYLHDLAAIRDFQTVAAHAAQGAAIARELLTSGGWPAAVIDGVCRAIESHSSPVALGQGSAEEVCLSNADVLSHIARPAYWFFYLYGIRGLSYEEGLAWLKGRVGPAWAALTGEARALAASEHAAAVELLGVAERPD